MLTAVALVTVFCGPASAKVTGVCSGCHTMHNSQGGDPMAKQLNATHTDYEDDTTANGTLLVKNCVGCHSSTGASGNEYPTYNLGGCEVPVVNKIGGEPSEYLAGGNFWWVADAGGNRDAAGHNVLGISGVDSLPYAPGGFNCGSNNNCHKSLAEEQIMFAGSGCQGCHLSPAHHADDSATVIGADISSTDGYYRFLSGHGVSYADGVCGIEDDDWQASKGAGDHNEYLGFSATKTGTISLSNSHTVTAFCCGCHGNFHIEESGKWIRHPSDAVIPDTGEYADAFGAGGTGTGIYDALVPVARQTLSAVSSTVSIGTDMVMCLSCHRPHGSEYDDLLRWDYATMNAGGDKENTTGCFACHTKKDTGS